MPRYVLQITITYGQEKKVKKTSELKIHHNFEQADVLQKQSHI